MEHRPSSVGEILRRARMERGLSFADVDAVLHVRERYLQALEADDYAALPPNVYTRALIREYARFLGLDPTVILDRTLPMRPYDRNPIRPAILPLEKPPLVSLKAAATVGVIAMCTGLFMYLYAQYNSFAQSVELRQTPSLQALSTPPARNITSALLTPFPTFTLGPPPTPQPSATPVAGLVIETRMVERSWLQVWADNRPVFAENAPAGMTRTFTAAEAIRMRVGNAGGVDVTVNGDRQGRLGSAGQALEVSWGRE